MTTPHLNVRPPAITEVPQPPTEFGKDRGRFYQYYDSIADEVDDDMTKALKEQLDGLLIFAGLFAGVNSAFLGLSLPLLSPDAADDTNALLAQNNALLLSTILGSNDSLPTNFTLPSTTFAPSGRVITTNVLFSLSLTFALISSFIAVVGRQWLIYYRKRSGAGPDRQRWDQLRRFLGAKRWRLELVLDDLLPSLLQLGLVVFCIAFVLHLRILNFQVSLPVEITLYASLGIFTFSAICTLCDSSCPFQTPLSRLLFLVMQHVLSALVPTVRRAIWYTQHVLSALVPTVRRAIWYTQVRVSRISHRRLAYWHRVLGERTRTPLEAWTAREPGSYLPLLQDISISHLQVTAARRIACTSDDPEALLIAMANLLTIDDASSLQHIWTDPFFRDRLIDQCLTAYDRTLEWQGRDKVRLATESARFYRAVLGHFLRFCYLSELKIEFMLRVREVCRQRESQVHTNWAPAEFISISSPLLIDATLAWSLIQLYSTGDPRDAAMNRITVYSEALLRPRWRLLSLVLFGVFEIDRPRDGVIIDMESDREKEILLAVRKVHIAYSRSPGDITNSLCDAMPKPTPLPINEPDGSACLLKNIIICAVHLVMDTEDLEIERRCRFFRIMELYLRQVGTNESIAQLWRSSRSQLVHQLGERLAPYNQNRTSYWSAECVREQVESLLDEMRKLSMTEHTRNENRRLATVFDPLVHRLNLVQVSYNEESWARDLDVLNRTFRDLRDNNKVMKKEITRDPDQSWCHWRDEVRNDPIYVPGLRGIGDDQDNARTTEGHGGSDSRSELMYLS